MLGTAGKHCSLESAGKRCDYSLMLLRLGIPCTWAVNSVAAVRSMTALQHLRIYCTPDDCVERNFFEAWESLFEIIASYQRLQRLDIVRPRSQQFDLGDMFWDCLDVVLNHRPHLAITVDSAECFSYF